MTTGELERLATMREALRNGEAERIRRELDLSRAELAAAVHVSERTIQRWEAGDVRPSGDPARRYAAVLATLFARQKVAS